MSKAAERTDTPPDLLGSAGRRDQRAAWLLFALLAYFPLFMHLDVLPLRIWDESRQAISALEMMRDHNWLVTHFYGEPDHWSTKPPLLVWCQTGLFMLLGPGELALRLPSALSALFTGALLMWVCSRWLGRPWMGLMAALFMFTSDGYINMHVARSGDYDAMLTLFMMLGAVSFWRYLSTGSRRSIVIFFVALTGGILTKSVQSLLFLPGLVAYLLIGKHLRSVLLDRRIWLGMLISILVIGAFYLGRESIDPGYLKAVWENELGGRYASTLEGHTGRWDFYIQRAMDHHFSSWYMLVPAGIILGLFMKDAAMRDWAMLLTACGGGYLLVVSSSATKCEWYDAPLYPVLGALCAIASHAVFEWLATSRPFAVQLRRNPLPALAMGLLFVLPYAHTMGRVYFPKDGSWLAEFYAPGHYLQKAQRGQRELTANVLCYDDYNAHFIFYVNVLNEQGKSIRSISKRDLLPGQRPMASEPSVKQFIESTYRYRVIEDVGAVRVYEILAPLHEEP